MSHHVLAMEILIFESIQTRDLTQCYNLNDTRFGVCSRKNSTNLLRKWYYDVKVVCTNPVRTTEILNDTTSVPKYKTFWEFK
jgi:hypothetical protein